MLAFLALIMMARGFIAQDTIFSRENFGDCLEYNNFKLNFYQSNLSIWEKRMTEFDCLKVYYKIDDEVELFYLGPDDQTQRLDLGDTLENGVVQVDQFLIFKGT